MSDSISLSTFPNGKIAALTMLYLQSINVSSLTPEQLLDKYDEVYEKINEHSKNKRKTKNTGWI